MDRETIEKNIRRYRARLDEASAKWGGVEICAVTKQMDAETINCAYSAGIRTIGENRVQELMGKIDQINPAYSIHLIGSLQSNKVKYIINRVDMIQSVDHDSLAEEISRRALAAGRVMPVLVQVNPAGEKQKGGVDPSELDAFIKSTAALEGLRIQGLMAIMPFAEDPEEVRPYFKQMRGLFDRLRDAQTDRVEMKILSMGMSADCIVAAEEGATMVRLGRAIFGARQKLDLTQGV